MVFPIRYLTRILVCVNLVTAGLAQTIPSSTNPERPALYHKPPETVTEGEDVSLTVALLEDVRIVSAQIYFREAGGQSYLEIEMSPDMTQWGGTIPGARITGDYIEYFISMQTQTLGVISFPDETPFQTPYRIPVEKRAPSGRVFPGQKVGKQQRQSIRQGILILSPEPGTLVSPNDVVIAISLFSAKRVNPQTARVILDDVDITVDAEIDEGILTVVQDKLTAGMHFVSIYFQSQRGIPIEPVTWSFTVSGGGLNVMGQLSYNGDVSSRFSSEYVGGNSQNTAELSGQLRGGITWASTRNSFRLTSRESPYQQPFNRWSGSVKFGDYLTVNLGDFNPTMSPYLIDGRRVRGIGVHVKFSWFEFQLVSGDLKRAVQHLGTVNGGYTLHSDDTDTDSLGTHTYYLDRSGYTFRREVDAYRIRLNYKSRFLLGIHALKAKDDITTVDKLIDANAKFSTDSSATGITPGIYTYSEFQSAAQATGGQVVFPSKNWGGGDPVDNLVAGLDLGTTFDNRRMVLEFSWNMSLYNRNIWDGAVTRAEMDTTLDDSLDGWVGVNYYEDGNIVEGSLMIDTSKIFDPSIYEGLFIINPYMTPLIPFDMASYGNHPIATVVNMPSSAFHFKFAGHYRLNNFQIEYRQVGPEFTSLGNPYLTSNIREFIISDRLTLLDRKLHLNGSYSYRDNKILRSTVDPVVTKTTALSVMLMPGPDVPSFMVNVQSIGKANEIIESEENGTPSADQDLRQDYRTNNTVISLNFPFDIMSVSNNLVVNYNTVLNTDLLASERAADYIFNRSDTKSLSVNLTTRFTPMWRTILNVSRTDLLLPTMVDGEITTKPYIWTQGGITTNYAIFENKLRLLGNLNLLRNQGDILSNIIGMKLGGDYRITPDFNLTLSGNLQYNQIPTYRTDGQDNDGNGKVDEWNEAWSLNTSGILLTLGYKIQS